MPELQPGVTVVIPTIPPRKPLLDRAVASVRRQLLKPDGLVIEGDRLREGAAVVRNRGLSRVETEWTAFLDDDDEFKPEHLIACMRWQRHTGADLVYPWFDQPEKNWDGLFAFGVPFEHLEHDLARRNFIPVTVLVRTQLLRDVGGFASPPGVEDCEDWGAWQRLLAAGATFSHLPRRTWIWHHWIDRTGQVGNTSGRADRW
jgi:glycosyltransferase involved in cell wall biosynthesis